jgi:transcriptional regulator with XRE-family HTH domain
MAGRKAATDKGFGDDRYRALVGALVAARKELGWSQEALANTLGRHQQFVSRYELGERRLDAVEFVDVARALKLDPAKIIAGVP